jgi:hypothetical protein
MAKLMRIRRADACSVCGAEMAAGTEAYWISSERAVRCTACHETVRNSTDDPSPTPGSGHNSNDVAGASAQREYERRSERERVRNEERIAKDAAWRASVREQRPILGRIATGLTPRPKVGPETQPTRAWSVGAEGERRVAEVLAGVTGIEILHDRLVPGSRANIDHIVVSASGVFVIDAKKYEGNIGLRDVGSIFRPDERLYVNGRDRTKLVDGVLKQVEVVRTVLGNDFDDIQVKGVLCFIGCDWGVFPRPKRIRGVTALWPKALPDHVAATGSASERVAAVAAELRARLRPAT